MKFANLNDGQLYVIIVKLHAAHLIILTTNELSLERCNARHLYRRYLCKYTYLPLHSNIIGIGDYGFLFYLDLRN